MLQDRRYTSDRRRRTALGGLGLVTVVAYGACYYAFGAFIGPISVATGWPQGTLGVVFAGVLVLNGALATFGGRLVDRRGPRAPLVIAGTVGAGAMFVASVQSSLAGFAIAYIAGCGLVGAMAYYHVTQPTAARAAARPERAIVRLTIFGAFASPVYLPLTEVLVHAIGWRSALRVEAGTVSFACLAAAAAVVSGDRPIGNGSALGPVSSALRSAWGHPDVRRWVVAVLIGTAATDLMLTYQVAIMVALGLSATVAASVAGLRGLAQLGGRLPLGAVLRHWGTRRALVAAHLVAVASAGALLLSGHLWAAVTFSVLAGISLGAITSLQGLYTNELIDPQHFGALFGALQGVIGIGGAAGPALGGLVLDLGGSHRLLVVVMTVGLVAAIAVLATGPPQRACS
jgi:MFS family permease